MALKVSESTSYNGHLFPGALLKLLFVSHSPPALVPGLRAGEAVTGFDLRFKHLGLALAHRTRLPRRSAWGQGDLRLEPLFPGASAVTRRPPAGRGSGPDNERCKRTDRVHRQHTCLSGRDLKGLAVITARPGPAFHRVEKPRTCPSRRAPSAAPQGTCLHPPGGIASAGPVSGGL